MNESEPSTIGFGSKEIDSSATESNAHIPVPPILVRNKINDWSPADTLAADSSTLFTVFNRPASDSEWAPKDLVAGQLLGRYRIIRTLGRGGSSNVYEAEHIPMKRRVAIKTMRSEFAGSSGMKERFMREASVLATMSGYGVVEVYDADIIDDLPMIVLEFLKGPILDTLLHATHEGVRFSVTDLLEDMSRVLVRQEKLRIVHRDIKPGNIGLRPDGEFCLLDYGLVGADCSAKEELKPDDPFQPITQDGFIMGTPMYMSPEQGERSNLDIRSDIYSLGLVAIECLTGTVPNWNEKRDFVESIRNRTIPDLDNLRERFPPGLIEIVKHMTKGDPNDRYQSANALLHDIERLKYKGGRPRGPRRGKVFVAIEFSTRYQPTFDAIQDACDSLRLEVRRMDRLAFSDEIWFHMVRELESANVVVADLSPRLWGRGPNPNVVTEAAHARAVKKPLILITTGVPEDLPFDWRGMPVITYSRGRSGLAKLRAALSERLHEMLPSAAHKSG